MTLYGGLGRPLTPGNGQNGGEGKGNPYDCWSGAALRVSVDDQLLKLVGGVAFLSRKEREISTSVVTLERGVLMKYRCDTVKYGPH